MVAAVLSLLWSNHLLCPGCEVPGIYIVLSKTTTLALFSFKVKTTWTITTTTIDNYVDYYGNPQKQHSKSEHNEPQSLCSTG